jgi:4'-phosphopantetheinyl transferase
VSLARPAVAIAELDTFLTPTERDRVTRLRTAQDARRALVSRGALRAILAGYLGVAPAAVPLRQSAAGKPLLESGELSFNLSRRGDLALIAIGAGGRIGVDIEPVAPQVELDATAALVLTAAERREFERVPMAERSRAFLVRWTAKEAYLKAHGDGLRADPQGVEVAVDGSRIELRDAGGRPIHGWWLRSCPPGPGWIGALASDRACVAVESRDWEAPT